MSTRRRIHLAAGIVGMFAVVTAAVPFAAHADSSANKDLAAARAATAKYHDEAVALADGYLRDDFCTEGPDGVMGYHYVNPALLEAPMDVRTPPILIYQPRSDGSRKLVAVAYFQVDADQDLSTDDDRPSLFGQGFDGPMDGHGPDMPRHYDLHAWVWQHNPDGKFAQFNPAGSC
ncbi:MAG: hypothetical protein GEV04_21880 [Actinophytocola sp.]|nr:hypothetical protein [Actinophytocola sp.]